MVRYAFPILLVTLALTMSGCEIPRAHGDVNALIVGADPDLWTEVEPTIREAMEPTTRTVRNEETFRVTHQDPADAEIWGNLRRFRQVIAMGDASDPWVEAALAEARADAIPDAPGIIQVGDVWARGQQVSVILLPEQGQAQAVRALADELHILLDEQFRSYAVNRMFLTGVNTELASSLAESAGFSLQLPQVYETLSRDSIFRFRNDNPSPTELIREVIVTWESPIPEELPTAEELRVWRDSIVVEHYVDRQLVDTTSAVQTSYQPIELDGLDGVEYQGAWVSPEDAWPAGGPFILRALRCPEQDRLYYVDAWLYAPNRGKYEYMIQLETILDSFRCGAGSGGSTAD